MTPTEAATILRHLDGWPVQNHSCKKVQEALDAAVEMLERMEKMESALQDHHTNAMCKGCDHSHSLTQLRLSAYQQSKLYADTVSALEK